MDDFLLMILLIYSSLQIDLYKIHRLPALHPDLGVQLTYILEGQYLAISAHRPYVVIPTEHDIRVQMDTKRIPMHA